MLYRDHEGHQITQKINDDSYFQHFENANFVYK
jgi:hypothetical protein